MYRKRKGNKKKNAKDQAKQENTRAERNEDETWTTAAFINWISHRLTKEGKTNWSAAACRCPGLVFVIFSFSLSSSLSSSYFTRSKTNKKNETKERKRRRDKTRWDKERIRYVSSSRASTPNPIILEVGSHWHILVTDLFFPCLSSFLFLLAASPSLSHLSFLSIIKSNKERKAWEREGGQQKDKTLRKRRSPSHSLS